MKNYKLTNNIVGWIVFAIAAFTYLSTMEPTASWWDCGEYIATSYKLEVGHPPGAPTFQLLGRAFSLFDFGDVTKAAMMINALSALASAFTILFLFWTITHLSRKIFLKNNEADGANMIAVLGSGVVGALAYTFSDSFWFSAVEGEVYGLSSFFSALVFWAILKWEESADKDPSYRWIIFISFMVGLSIGVHLLNLLAVPAIVLVVYFKKYKPSIKGVIFSSVLSVIMLAMIMYGIIPEVANLFANTELLFVNSFGLPFNSGSLFFALLLIMLFPLAILFTRDKLSKPLQLLTYILLGIIVLLVLYSGNSAGSVVLRILIISLIAGGIYYLRSRKAILNTIILSILFLMIGYSSFITLIIRSHANTPIDENNVEDAVSFLAYLNREQYGDMYLFSGPYYNAPVVSQKEGNPMYIKNYEKGNYKHTGNRLSYIYDKSMSTIFPRLWSGREKVHIREYKWWVGEGKVPVRVTDRSGNSKILKKPSFGQNLQFFFKHQVGFMYWRYFMWNFSGRQNDTQGYRNTPNENGNWITGINFLDQKKVGNLNDAPDSLKSNAHNKYYLLPFLLGLIGVLFQIKKDKNSAFVVGLLFLMTGLAIVLFLNQYPHQPRERDYAYVGSFYAFAIWIGFGVLYLYGVLSKFLSKNISAILASLLCLLLVPTIMAKENWKDHDRSKKTVARDAAFNYLNTCDENALLVTNGDNDTFPLWYAQEVEGIRTDVRVVNFVLASGTWYIHQMMQKMYDSEPLPFTLSYNQYQKGTNDIIPFYDKKVGRRDLKEVIEFIASDSPSTKVTLGGEKINFFPTKKIRLYVDKEKVLENGIVPPEMADRIVPYIDWDIKKNNLQKNDLMLLDIIATNNWERPIYFASPYSSVFSQITNIKDYCHLEGFAYKFMPVKAKGRGSVNTEKCYDLLINKARWGNVSDTTMHIDAETNRAFWPGCKQRFLNLSMAFYDEQKNDSVINVIDKYFEIFPAKNFPHDIYTTTFVDLYFQTGATEKAVALAREIGYDCGEEIDYYVNQPDHIRPYFKNEINDNMKTIARLRDRANQLKQEELAAELTALLKEKTEMTTAIQRN